MFLFVDDNAGFLFISHEVPENEVDTGGSSYIPKKSNKGDEILFQEEEEIVLLIQLFTEACL